MTLFDHIKQLTDKKVPTIKYWNDLTEADKKTFSNYMVHRFLSMDSDFTEIVNYCQQFNLEPEMMYRLYMDIIPKRKRWLKYVKGKKSTKYESWLIELLAVYYECSIVEATDYVEILYMTDIGKAEIRTIAQMYGTDKKLIKKAKL